jgi:hypothetical protein
MDPTGKLAHAKALTAGLRTAIDLTAPVFQGRRLTRRHRRVSGHRLTTRYISYWFW